MKVLEKILYELREIRFNLEIILVILKTVEHDLAKKEET